MVYIFFFAFLLRASVGPIKDCLFLLAFQELGQSFAQPFESCMKDVGGRSSFQRFLLLFLNKNIFTTLWDTLRIETR